MLDGCTPWPEEFVDRYWAAGHWRGYTLDNLLRGWALEYGPRTALVHGDTRLTYANLNRRVDRLSAGIRLRGIRPGMRVVVQLPNVPEFVVTVFALMRAGAVPVLCPLSHPAAELPELVRVTQAVGYVAPATHQGVDHMAVAADIAARWPFLRRVFTLEEPGSASPYGGLTTDPAGCQYAPLGSVDAPPEPALIQRADRPAFLLLADGGGTAGTGLVPRTHDDYAYQARAAAERVSLGGDDVYLAALPAGSGLALGCPGIIGTLSVGGTVVLADPADPGACLRALRRERVTLTSVGPATAERWLEALPAAGAGPGGLRLVQIGSEASVPPVPRTTADRLGAALGCDVQQAFWMAEGPLLLTRAAAPGCGDTVPAEPGHHPLSPDDEIRLVGADGRDVPEGEAGELLARGPYTARGYYRSSGHDARSFTADGYFRTGRLARRAPDGGLVVTGRCGELPTG
ncbi:AMP-binding protein [Streptomyces sp. NPDC012888]|uniref:AMP-binding protein n=1 Tax=Streptomyces sp. NPDC012888 TaxID=3364855 RepID=UPI0036991F32